MAVDPRFGTIIREPFVFPEDTSPTITAPTISTSSSASGGARISRDYEGLNFDPTNWTWKAKPVASEVNDVSDAQETIREQTVLASNDIIPVTFGCDRFYGKLMLAYAADETLYVAYLIGKGEISAVQNVYVDGVEINDTGGLLETDGTAVNTYTGTQAQGVDPLLSANIPGFNSAYTGYAYIVLQLPPNSTNGFPRVEVEIDGHKVKRYDYATAFETTTGGAGTRNLSTESVDPDAWGNTGAPTQVDTGTDIGEFNECRVASSGANTDVIHCAQDITEGANLYAITLYYKEGTSGRYRIRCRDEGTTTDSLMTGTVGGTPSIDNSAGTITFLQDEDHTTYRILRLLYAPNNPGNQQRVSIGPDSNTVGEDIYVYAGQVENADAVTDETIEFTDNPINVVAHVMETFAGWTVNSSSASAAAQWNNDRVPADLVPRRQIGMTYSRPVKVSRLIRNLMAYTGCVYYWENGEIFFRPYRAGSTVHTFGEDVIADGGIRLEKKKPSDIPTMVVVQYTDRSNDYQKRESVAKAAGVDTGATPRRISRVNLPGFHHHNQANREAIERLNTGLADLSVRIEVFDEGLEAQIGDVCEITHPIGLTDKKMIITSLSQGTPGMWIIRTEEYQPELFSEDVEGAPSYPDTQLPEHVPPPAVTNVTAVEEVYQRRNGEYDNRLRITWDASTSPYTQWYIVRIKQGGNIISSFQEVGLETAYGPVQELIQYTIEVAAGTTLFQGAAGSTTITPQGKFLVPGDVSNFDGIEIGGEVRLNWDEAIDLDITAYEIRYGTSGVTWANADVLNLVDSLRYSTKDVPPGTWDFLIKARDSVGQESVNAARLSNLAVTLDDKALLIDSGPYIDASAQDLLVHRVKEKRGGNDIIYTDTSGETWATLFGGSPLSGKTNPLASYQSSPGSNFRWRSAETDVATDVSGDFQQLGNWTSYNGSVIEYMDIATESAYPTFTEYTTLSQKTTGRYMYMELRGQGLARLDTGIQNFKISAVTRKEDGEATSFNSGAYTVEVSNLYTKYKNITITPINVTVGRYAVVDNIDIVSNPNSFDVYIFRSDTDAQVATDFLWSWEGV